VGLVINTEEIIEKLTYKPGWDFTPERKAGRDTLVIGATVQHSETLDMVRFRIRRIIPQVAMTAHPPFLSWVEDELAEAEFHELREFFRYDGRLVDDPHESTTI
jgi:hypothetical protein